MRADYEINWDLLDRLKAQPHPLHKPELDHECSEGVSEVMHEVLAAHHLLDLAGIPRDHQGRQPDVTDLDARVFLVVRQLQEIEMLLDRVRTWHRMQTGPAGMVSGLCNECRVDWPCDTYKLASGAYEQ